MTNCLLYNVSMLGCHSVFKKSPMSEVTVMFLKCQVVKSRKQRSDYLVYDDICYFTKIHYDAEPLLRIIRQKPSEYRS